MPETGHASVMLATYAPLRRLCFDVIQQVREYAAISLMMLQHTLSRFFCRWRHMLQRRRTLLTCHAYVSATCRYAMLVIVADTAAAPYAMSLFITFAVTRICRHARHVTLLTSCRLLRYYDVTPICCASRYAMRRIASVAPLIRDVAVRRYGVDARDGVDILIIRYMAYLRYVDIPISQRRAVTMLPLTSYMMLATPLR